MGTWGLDFFDNDDAMDWLGDLSPATAAEAVEGAIARVLDHGDGDYLESPDCQVALAAAELTAAALGRPADSVPEYVSQLRASVDSPTLPMTALRARAALDRIEKESELRELLEEVDALEPWMDLLDALRERLKT